MGDGQGLDGARVLIVEDEFYIAQDIADMVRQAGGTVLGPCPDTESALAEIDAAPPDIAIVDINHGSGPTFVLPDILSERGIRFLFLTGYDALRIPDRFAGVECLAKPLFGGAVVGTLTAILSRGKSPASG